MGMPKASFESGTLAFKYLPITLSFFQVIIGLVIKGAVLSLHT